MDTPCNPQKDTERVGQMGFWDELKKANPHQGVARGNELASATITNITPIDHSLENSGETCSVCMAQFGSFGFRNVQPYTVTIDKATQLSFTNESIVTVCAKCISVFDIG
jgi:hypothetical protein